MSAIVNVSRSMLGTRQKILQTTLWATVILASIAYVPSVILAYQQEIWSLLVVDTIAWLAILVLAVTSRLSYPVRAAMFLAVWAAVGIFLLWLLGPVGAGAPWLLTVPILSALFFGFRGAFSGIAFIILVAVAYGALLVFADAPNPLDGTLVFRIDSWFGVSGTLIFLSALISLTTARLLAGLEKTMIELEVSRQRVTEALEEREQLQEQLLHSQKLSALGTMASGIAHDFNNLLQPILMASEEARELAPPGSTQQQHIDNAIISAERAAQLVKRILSFSQYHDANASSTQVAPALQETAALLRSSMPANITIRVTNRAPEDVCVLATPDVLHQITMNLGTNACLAMKPKGGTLEFCLDLSESGNEVLLTIRDSGVGIPADIQHRIFEPFFTTREPGTSNGLGLAIVYKLVTELGGSIQVSSQRGQGAEFVLTFKASAPDKSATGISAPDTTRAASLAAPYRIMVVDDEALVRATIRMTLERDGMQVVDHASPDTALAQLETMEGDAVDLLVTDQAMPGMTGIQLAARIRALRPTLPILLVSGNLTEEERKEIQSLHHVVTLDKPFSRKLLLAAVDTIRFG